MVQTGEWSTSHKGAEMPNYNESAVSGTSWQRCHTVTVRNPLGGLPMIEFAEEKVIMIDGTPINQWVAGCWANFDMNGSFPILDPATNAPTGVTMTHAQLYQAMYSLYMQTAAARDAAP
jgi:hypothetical protein